MEDLLGQIYETVAAPEAWTGVTRDMARSLDAHATWLIQPALQGPALFAFSGIAPEAMADYAAHYHTVDVFVQAGMRRFAGQMPGPLREREILHEASYRRSEVFNDWLRPNGIGGFLTAALAPIEGPAPPVLTFFRPTGAAPFAAAEAERLAALLPHFRRAVRMRLALAGATGLGVTGLTLLEQLPHAALLLDAAGRVLHANAAGRALLDRRDGIALQAGRLVAASRGEAAALAALLAGCLAQRPGGGEMLLRREDGGIRLLSAMPLPMPGGATLGEARCRAWVTVMDPERADERLAGRLMPLFGLSPAEARVAAALAQGLTPAEIAASHRVAMPTIRTQIAAVYGKLGIGRQADLLRLLTAIGCTPRVAAPPPGV